MAKPKIMREFGLRSIGGVHLTVSVYDDGVLTLYRGSDTMHLTKAGVRRLARELGMKVEDADGE